ncbi:MAG: hypothetical protein U5K30_00625 [Acidimicrobiales bacterium]|nr:hypothetical protein [Acidimicrobiales bacterium]
MGAEESTAPTDMWPQPGCRQANDSERGPRPIAVACFASLGAILFVIARLVAHDGDITSFMRVGDEWIVEGAEEREDFALVGGIGYDGQYFYRQAINPLSTAVHVDGIPLDRPAYRSARITYPTIAWALSGGGQRELVPWVLPAINVIAIGAIGGVGATLARREGRTTWWGAVFAAWPGFIVGLGFNLAEPVAAALVLWGVLELRREHHWVAGVALSAAVLTRESALIVSAALVGVWLLRRVRFAGIPDRLVGTRLSKIHLAPMLAPPVAYLGMQWWMARRFPGDTAEATSQSATHLGNLPGAPLVRQLAEWVSSGSTVQLFQLVQVLGRWHFSSSLSSRH